MFRTFVHSNTAVIILNLRCDKEHRFEGWFASSEAFREQRAHTMVTCPHCDSAEVTQLPSAPYVRRLVSDAPTPESSPASELAAEPSTKSTVAEGPSSKVLGDLVDAPLSATAHVLFNMLASMARKAENVGERFPEEARRIHYEEVAPRTIRGTATAEEAMDLIEEGIMVMPTLLPPENETH